jgi:hypothetical protein
MTAQPSPGSSQCVLAGTLTWLPQAHLQLWEARAEKELGYLCLLLHLVMRGRPGEMEGTSQRLHWPIPTNLTKCPLRVSSLLSTEALEGQSARATALQGNGH